MVRIGVLAPYVDGLITSGGFLRDFAGTLEDCGVESLWTVEHVAVAESYEPLYPYSDDGRMPGPETGVVPMTDPLETIAFAAGCTTTLRFGTAMVVAPLHSPVVLAKRAATIDLHSDGRLLLGLGIGWQKEEYAAVGVPYRARGARLDDCIGAMRTLWADAPASFHGTHVSFDGLHCVPQPAGGAIPIVLGGNSEPAVQRAARLADGWFPYTIGPEDFALRADLIRETADAVGRASDAVEFTAWPGSCDMTREFDPDFIRPYVTAGASRLVINPPLLGPESLLGPRGLDGLRDYLARYQDTLEKL
ncbi:TIGR03619 family F420-dependent LLM class oxidoreductase [Nocardia pseudovaccinii]|uniref:TIGR03619 family F420-dependent LLM class oxidoreductase n=1 Tax=Nocardia pseudovaccinii TaxID=189540 RepID=UPI0007A4DABD|nr:TIGR03619 family F420-dependent LLM class oxidoreductase [Nocardia pseudovaccinii]